MHFRDALYLLSCMILLLYSISSNARPRPGPVKAGQITDAPPLRWSSQSSEAREVEYGVAIIGSKAVAPLLPRQDTASMREAFMALFGRPMIFGHVVAFGDSMDPIAALIALLSAIAESASNKWRSSTPVRKLNIVFGAVQISLASTVAISWDAVGYIANKLMARVEEGFYGFFGAVTWYPESPGNKLVLIGIGVGLATAFLGAAYLGTAAYLLDQIGNQVDQTFGAIALIPPPLPAAQILGDAMLMNYGLAAPAAK